MTELDLDGVVATNTTTERPASLRSPNAVETGGLSGKPIENQATEMVRFVAERVDVPVVGVGGVSTAEAHTEDPCWGLTRPVVHRPRLRGPSLARDINRDSVTCSPKTASTRSRTPSVQTVAGES